MGIVASMDCNNMIKVIECNLYIYIYIYIKKELVTPIHPAAVGCHIVKIKRFLQNCHGFYYNST
jgi:hypothetical protein